MSEIGGGLRDVVFARCGDRRGWDDGGEGLGGLCPVREACHLLHRGFGGVDVLNQVRISITSAAPSI